MAGISVLKKTYFPAPCVKLEIFCTAETVTFRQCLEKKKTKKKAYEHPSFSVVSFQSSLVAIE